MLAIANIVMINKDFCTEGCDGGLPFFYYREEVFPLNTLYIAERKKCSFLANAHGIYESTGHFLYKLQKRSDLFTMKR